MIRHAPSRTQNASCEKYLDSVKPVSARPIQRARQAETKITLSRPDLKLGDSQASATADVAQSMGAERDLFGVRSNILEYNDSAQPEFAQFSGKNFVGKRKRQLLVLEVGVEPTCSVKNAGF